MSVLNWIVNYQSTACLPSPSDASPRENLPTGVALPAGVALPTGARDQDEAGRRNPAGKAKGKAKKSDSNQPTDADLEVTIRPTSTQIYNHSFI